jgi:myo-inositol 2-dehydrogenase/D-chiro-inositol 1-dehydrogenase
MTDAIDSSGHLSGKSSSLDRRAFLGTASAAAFSIMNASLVRGTQANSKLEAGCIGLGARGRLICRLMAQHPGYQLVAAADYFPDVVQKAAESLNVPENRCYSGLLGYRRLIESKVDAVLLEAPPYCFPDHAAAAVEAGRHVYMAKPVAVDVPGCLRISALGKEASRKQRVFFVDFQMRTDPFIIESVKRVHEGLIGEISLLSSHYSSEGFPDPEKTATIEDRLQNLVWTNDIAIGGGHFVNAGIHAIDAALWIARELPVSAMGCTRTLRANPHGDSPDIDSFTFQFNSGIVLNHCGEHVKNKHPFLCTASAFGRDGYIETSYTGNSFVRANEGGYEGGPATNLYNQGIKRNLDAFYEKVTGAAYDNPTVETSVNSTLVTILGREAGARNGLVTWDELLLDNKRVAVDLTGLKE